MQTQTLTRSCTLSFEELQKNEYLFKRINTLCGLMEYKLHKPQLGRAEFDYYDFTNGTNAWRFDGFITDAQWKTIAQLCISYKADIAEVIRGFVFETEKISVVDGEHSSTYFVPTSMCGYIKNIYFLIEEDGRSNT
jgi:hypothetical protein